MSCFAGPEIVNNDLVLALDAGNTKSYPGSGTAWTDLTGRTTGTLFNTPSYSSTDGNGSFTFAQASSQYVDIGSVFDNLFSSGITIQAWIKTTSYTLFNRVFTISDAAGTGYQYWIQTNQTTGFIQFGTAPSAYAASVNAVGLNTWVNIAGTCKYGANSIKIYLNGIDNSGTSTGTPAYTADVGTAYIGRLNAAGGANYGNFSLSNIQTYNRALTAAEIQQNFNAFRGRFGI